jgi:hypothetical protein
MATATRCKMRKMYDRETTEQWLEFDFNVLLHKRGSDWWVYKNQWDKADLGALFLLDDESDTELIQLLVSSLMADDTGVYSIMVTPYTLKVFKSAAVDDQSIVDIINSVGALLDIS